MNRFLRDLLLREAINRGIFTTYTDKIALIMADAFPAQLALINSSDNYIACDSGRRAGKTDALLRKIIITMLTKPGKIAFVSQSTGSSKELIWQPLQELNEKYELGMRFNHSELTAMLPNGSRLRLSGLATSREIGKLRGKGYTLIVCDETQRVSTDMDDFVQSVCIPALLDKRGQLLFTGTADPFRRNRFWHEAATGLDKRWKHYQWSIFENPNVDAKTFLAEKLAEGSYTETDPRYRAEFFGDWTLESSSLLISDYTEANNCALPLLGTDTRYVCGLDIGNNDATAWVVFAYNPGLRMLYIIHTHAKSGLSEDEMGAYTLQLLDKYPKMLIVCDEGALGKVIARSIGERYRLPIIPAQKNDKALKIAFLNSDFRSKRLMLAGSHPELIQQIQSVTWNEKHTREAEGQVCDLIDAMSYGATECRNYRDAKQKTGIPMDDRERLVADRKRGVFDSNFKPRSGYRGIK